MKDQYFGDANDFRKYGLLRALNNSTGLRLGVCWMLTEPDCRNDGKFLKYLDQPRKFRDFYDNLHSWLVQVIKEGKCRRTKNIETSELLDVVTEKWGSMSDHHPIVATFSAQQYVVSEPADR